MRRLPGGRRARLSGPAVRARAALGGGFFLAILTFAVPTACREEDPSDRAAAGDRAAIVEFGAGRVRIETPTDTLRLETEIAENDAQRIHGLMDRDTLAEDAGMLFVYAEPRGPRDGFWMYRTRIPLDIAFLDAEGRIVAIRSMEPCASPDPRWCPTYEPGVPYTAALEVRRGWFERHGVRVGDRVVRVPVEPATSDGV